MSEMYTYGGNGSEVREEYNALGELDMRMYMEMVSAELESCFASTQQTHRLHCGFVYNENVLRRTIRFQYDNFEEQTLVEVSHVTLNSQPLQERYEVRIELFEGEDSVSVVDHYDFSLYQGHHWQAELMHSYDDEVLEEDDSEFSRTMTAYDFDEFFKHTAKIQTQIKLLLVQ
jgi:hypothetical protein